MPNSAEAFQEAGRGRKSHDLGFHSSGTYKLFTSSGSIPSRSAHSSRGSTAKSQLSLSPFTGEARNSMFEGTTDWSVVITAVKSSPSFGTYLTPPTWPLQVTVPWLDSGSILNSRATPR